jgi:hypothetical protein
MPDARLHFRSPAWQSLPVAGLPPANWPEPGCRLRPFSDRRARQAVVSTGEGFLMCA